MEAIPSSMPEERFRVVIVGGGPVGLTAAHALFRAGIDFVMLEARNTCIPEEGASLLAYASTHRVWHQLGLFAAMEAESAPIESRTILTHAGRVYRNGSPALFHRRLFGTPPWNFHRRNLVRVLYDAFPTDTRAACILTGKKVCEIAPDASGVTVRCEDGTIERGTMVLGVDGVHSKTRGMMWTLAMNAGADTALINPERPYRAEYRCLWGTCPRPAACPPKSNFEAHGSVRSLMFMTAHDQSWFFLYEQLDAPTDNARRDYAEADQEEFAARFTGMHVTPELVFGEVWPTRTACGMADQLEGVLPHWRLTPTAGGRVVLAGDAVHRFTPNFGWGYNSGVNDVAVLTSLLHAEVVQKQSPALSAEALDDIFARYQKARQIDDNIANVAANSAKVTRQSARPRQWLAAAVYWLLEHVVPLLILNFEMFASKKVLGTIMRRGRVLDFLPEDASARTDARVFGGELGWDFPIPTSAAVAEKSSASDSE